jgi:hypothetical protein
MEYLVVEVTMSDSEHEETQEPDVRTVHLCGDTRDVFTTIRSIGQRGADWAVFEVVEGKTYRRVVTYIYDGKTPYNCKLS